MNTKERLIFIIVLGMLLLTLLVLSNAVLASSCTQYNNDMISCTQQSPDGSAPTDTNYQRNGQTNTWTGTETGIYYGNTLDNDTQ